MYRNVVITLFEGHYEYGVAALLNSLVVAGFEGIFCVGYKGNLPFWLPQLKLVSEEKKLYKVSENVFVRFDLLENTGMHFGYYKPYYLKSMKEYYPDAKGYFYFDPDIVVIGRWSFFEEWIQSGVALCQDSNYTLLHWNHPWRNQWRKDFGDEHTLIDKSLNWYVNSGFIGVNATCFEIIERWIEVNEKYIKKGYPKDYFDKAGGILPYKGDQDVLNATMTVSNGILFSIMGKESMGFDYPHICMIHCLGVKPWQNNNIINAFKGIKPRIGDEAYLHYCECPIRLYSATKIKWMKLVLLLSKTINRLWSK